MIKTILIHLLSFSIAKHWAIVRDSSRSSQIDISQSSDSNIFNDLQMKIRNILLSNAVKK